MLQRQKLTLVRERLNQFPAVALLGPRQVGKRPSRNRSPLIN